MKGAPKFAKGARVYVSPPMTPLARHSGQIIRRARHGWRVEFNAWGMIIRESMPERCLQLAP